MAYLYELYLIKLICVIVENRMVNAEPSNAFKLFISAWCFFVENLSQHSFLL